MNAYSLHVIINKHQLDVCAQGATHNYLSCLFLFSFFGGGGGGGGSFTKDVIFAPYYLFMFS